MKDYRLSEVKAICIKNNHWCPKCELAIHVKERQRYFCRLCDRDPEFWEIEKDGEEE